MIALDIKKIDRKGDFEPEFVNFFEDLGDKD